MRKGWKTARLADVCTFKPPKKEARQRLNPEDAVSFVPMNNLGVRKKELELCEERLLEKVAGSYTYFAEGDVLLAKITPCFENGKLGIASGLTNGVGFGSSEFIVMRPGDELDAEYLFYLLSQDSVRDAGARVMSGAVGHKRVPKELVEGLQLTLPAVTEQKRIVAILDGAFAGIDTAIANTEKNLANARELFESYLNSVFSDAVMQWEEFPIEKHIKFIDYRGKTPKKTSSGLRLITAKNVRMGYLQREPEEFVDPETYDTWMTRGIPKKWDVLFTTEAPLGFACQLDTDEKVVFAQRIITMQPDRDIIHPDYLMFALRSSPIQSRIHEKATGATATGIKASLLKKIAIPVPEIIQQKVIAENAGSLEQESKRLEGIYEEKLTALAELKQSLLQKAFSGELTADRAGHEIGCVRVVKDSLTSAAYRARAAP